MAYTVPLVYNATEELVDADNYPELRLFTVAKIGSASVRNFCWLPPLLLTPRGTQFQANLLGIDQPWTVASSTSLNSTGTGFFYFSAVCWFAAKDIFNSLLAAEGIRYELSNEVSNSPAEFLWD